MSRQPGEKTDRRGPTNMVEVANVSTAEAFFKEVEPYRDMYFRGQSKEYPTITPGLFRRTPPLNIKPLIAPATGLYFTAHGVDKEVSRIRDEEFAHSRAMFRDVDASEGGEGWFDRVASWAFRKLGFGYPFVKHDDEPDYDPPDPDDPYAGLVGLRGMVGSGMGLASEFPELCGEPMNLYWQYWSDDFPISLLQHYGAPTPGIDVTYDPAIALWFAGNAFIRPSKESAAYYVPNLSPGVVYVMKSDPARVVDLRHGETIPIAGLRGWRQVGGLALGATAERPHFDDLVVKKITVEPGTFDPAHPRLSKLTQRYVFPPPDEDAFYRTLLGARTSAGRSVHRLAEHIVEYTWP